MAHEMLTILLGDVNDVLAVLDDTRPASEVLGVGEEAAPLGLEQVDHIEVLPAGLHVRALRRQEVNVGIATEPAPGVHIYPAFDAEFQPLLAWLDTHHGPQGFVFESTRHVHDHVAAREPTFAPSVNVGVCDLAHAHIAAHVYVPRVQVGVDLIVMAVRLVRYAVRRPEVDPAGDGSAGVVIHHGHLHPVAPAVRQLHADLGSLRMSLLLDLAPRQLGDGLTVLSDRHSRRGHCGDLGIRGAGVIVGLLSESLMIPGQEAVARVFGKRKGVG